jgi:hypothetical protein
MKALATKKGGKQNGNYPRKNQGRQTRFLQIQNVHRAGRKQKADWQAIEHNHDAVLGVLSQFPMWRVSRLDLERTTLVPLDEWRAFCKAAFEIGSPAINGKEDARTVYYGSRKSQFYTRIYNKTALDTKHYPAPDGFVQVRFEIEIHRVRGDLVLDRPFDTDFTNRLFIQRLYHSAAHDTSGFILKHFADTICDEKIKTVKRTIGNFEKTVDYVLTAYSSYIAASLNSQMIADRYGSIEIMDKKAEKVLAVIDSALARGGGG